MPGKPEPKLLLFDIDGTLLATGGAGERALVAAILEEFGDPDGMREIEIAGRTDSLIARQVLRRYGRAETPEEIARFLDLYLSHLTRLLPLTEGRLLPGIVPLLAALQQRDDILLGLLTGNLARGAELKLTQYGIWSVFSFGAYADDHHDRNELGRFACARLLEKHGLEIPPERIYVIGDTQHDIACGKAFGAKTIAVATGRSSVQELAAFAPDYVFEDLSDVEAVLAVFDDP